MARSCARALRTSRSAAARTPVSAIRFARMECVLALATISQRFLLVSDPGQRVTLHAATALRPRPGIRVNLTAAEAGL